MSTIYITLGELYIKFVYTLYACPYITFVASSLSRVRFYYVFHEFLCKLLDVFSLELKS